MRKVYDAGNLSHDSLAQGFKQRLKAAGITVNRQGKSISDMDFYELRNLLAIMELSK